MSGKRVEFSGNLAHLDGEPHVCVNPAYSGRGQRGLASSGLHGGPKFARNFGESPFGLFVIELPLSAACATVTLAGKGPDATERIPPQPKLCERASNSGPVRRDEDR